MVRPYERAVHIRGGKYKRTCGPGFYFKAFGYDEVVKINIVSDAKNLLIQVVSDVTGKSYIIGAVVKWRVREDAVKNLILDVEDYENMLHNTCYGMIAQECRSIDMAKITELEAASKTAIRRRLGRYGYDIEDLWITDISPVRVLRLVTGDGE